MALLEVQGLTKSFGSERVLKDISFSLEEGRSLVILGSSGNGKTTLLRCLTLLEQPDVGQVYLGGKLHYDAAEVSQMSPDALRTLREDFGLVFQELNLFPQYTALRNVSLALELRAKRELPRGERADAIAAARKRAEELLSRVGLGDKLNSYPCELSGGQRQRVAIARALAPDPKVLCFDEPTSALDPELTGEVLRVIRQLSQDGVTMILVTHALDFAAEAADEAIFLDGGTVAEFGPAKQLIEHPSTDRMQTFVSGIRRS